MIEKQISLDMVFNKSFVEWNIFIFHLVKIFLPSHSETFIIILYNIHNSLFIYFPICLFVQLSVESCDDSDFSTIGPIIPDACSSNPCPTYLDCVPNGVEFSCVCPENSIYCGGMYMCDFPVIAIYLFIPMFYFPLFYVLV